MNLKDFIKDTITQMAEAVDELNGKKGGVGLIVNPCTDYGDNVVTKAGCSYKQTSVHFNVALTILDEGATGGRIGVFGGWIGSSAKSESKNQSQALTSLDFELDVLLPQG